MSNLTIDYRSTALILVDIQKGLVGMPFAPLSADHLIASAEVLAAHFRGKNAPVVLVHMAFPSGKPTGKTDFAFPLPPTMPPGWDEIVDTLAPQAGDIGVRKQGWGAFIGTDLDARLKSKGIDTVIIAGITTNFGVESTAREAAGLGYAVIFASDVMTTLSAAHQDFALQNVFPMLGRVRTSAQIMN